jgi:alpha-beta hydrolase superfamily lysophospholipase
VSASPAFPCLPAHWAEALRTADGGIFLRAWSSLPRRTDPQRLLVVVHGQGEQSDRYEHFAHYLDGVVDAIVAVDLPGHGRSAGARGHVAAWSEYHDAVACALDFARATFGTGPALHLLGHSMGGLVVLGFLASRRGHGVRKAVISAPLLELGFPPPPLKLLAARLAGRLLPRLPLGNGIDAADLTHDAEVNACYARNPLNHSRVTPGWFVAMSDEADRLRALERLDTPSLWIVPLADRIVSAPAALEAARRIATGSDVQVETLPGFFHEAFNETGKDRVFARLARYLEE